MAAPPADFKALYDENLPMVRRVLQRLIEPSEDAMDLAQQVFLIAFRKLPEFDGRSKVSTWLYGVCRRVALKPRGSRAVSSEVSTDPRILEESIDHADEGSTDVALGRRAEVEHILSKVSEAQRLVFRLHEMEEMTGSEIAALLDVSLGTVRSRLHYARTVFRREVQRLAREDIVRVSKREVTQ